MIHMGKILLVVDDEPFIRTFLKARLSHLMPDITIKEAADGEQAMQIILHEHIDLITLDINMPFIGGVELINHLKQKPELSSLPIIVISANVPQNVRQSLNAMGVMDIFSKLEVTDAVGPDNHFLQSVQKYLAN